MLDLVLSFLFNDIDWSIVVDIISIITSSSLSIVAIIISIKTLKQSNNAIIESSRANIVFYVDTLTGAQQFLTIKNFGNSVGEILDININPRPDYSKSPKLSGKPAPVITDYKNIFLAPNQCIKSWFPFSRYPNKKFTITVKYKSLGNTYEETYSIDLSYIEAIDYLRKSDFAVNDEKQALVNIDNTLRSFSERF